MLEIAAGHHCQFNAVMLDLQGVGKLESPNSVYKEIKIRANLSVVAGFFEKLEL